MPYCPVKDTLVDLLRKYGYDFMTACEYATELIKELNQKPKGEYTYYIGNAKVLLRKD